jgi:hypothetical protein
LGGGDLDHPPYYNPDLTPNDYHLFAYLKNCSKSQCFNNGDLMEGVETWLSSQVTYFFDTGKQKLIPQYDKCLNSRSDYAEKKLMYAFFVYNIFFICCFINSSLEVTFQKAPVCAILTECRLDTLKATLQNTLGNCIKKIFRELCCEDMK